MPPNDVPPVSAFLHLYDEALPHVYGYLVRRCGSAATAEDLEHGHVHSEGDHHHH